MHAQLHELARTRRGVRLIDSEFDTHYDVHMEVYMRTNIVLDDDLVKEAFRHAPVKTKRELVDLGIRDRDAGRRRCARGGCRGRRGRRARSWGGGGVGCRF